ncbi:MAG: hypothetical protein B7733_20705 [Myxococcales bacterium FL481]|nr:MAG: hypothetical protein B7733_20705 [Myxococcales bacterium FL481]
MEMSDEDYFADTSMISSSMLKLYREDRDEFVARFITKTVKQPAPSSSMRLGTAVHGLWLEDIKPVTAAYIGTPGPCPEDLRGARKFAKANGLSGQPLSLKDGWLCRDMVDALEADKEASDYLTYATHIEQVVQWEAETDYGLEVACKAKIDLVAKIGGEIILVDLKTTRHPTETAFHDSVHQYGYAFSLAHYAAALGAVGMAPTRSVILAVCSKPPHRIFTIELEDKVFDFASRTNRLGLSKIAEDLFYGWSR